MKPNCLYQSSLERSLIGFALLSALFSALGCYLIGQYFALSIVTSVGLSILFLGIYLKLFIRTYKKVINSFNRNHAHLDAILNEDYNQLVKPTYQAGSINQLQQSLISLSKSCLKRNRDMISMFFWCTN